MPEGKHFSEALEYHSKGRPGKTEVIPTKPTATQSDLGLAYTPGVAEPCLEIAGEPADVFRYTNKGNLVAVVSNGTAVLGLGNIGPLAGKPVMEGKAVLFKRFADIDVFDIEIDTTEPADVIRFCEMLEPTVGGINLEDIRAPECFEIEDALKERLDIPVFHDDQHGTAIIAGAGFLNALDLTGRSIDTTTVVFNGAGAAGMATARFFERLGVRHENILMCDSRGVIYEGRKEGMSWLKEEFARPTDKRTLEEALVGADCFVGVSIADVVTKEMVQSMADNPIIFALANPNPEIRYEDAIAARSDAIVATGRSDYPNQVNNVLGFPFIFRGALDVRARGISEGMKAAAAHALADLARQPVPDSVLKAYSIDHLAFGTEYLIPKPFDPRVLWHVAPAVAQAAIEEGLARAPYSDIDEYREELRSRFQPAYGLTHTVAAKARAHPMRVVYPHGADIRIIRAARRVVEERIAAPVILGNVEQIRSIAREMQVPLEGIDLFDPYDEHEARNRYADALYRLRGRKGIAPEDARRGVLDPNLYAAMMLHEGDADAVLGGLTSNYPDTIRPALQVLPLEDGRSIVSAIYAVILKDQPAYFLADCAVNILPTSEQLAEIAISTADYVEDAFDVKPRTALLSYSNFGSASGEEPERVRKAVTVCWEQRPDLQVDGEMHARTAVDAPLLARQHSFNRLGGRANVLVFPNLAAGNAAYQLLSKLGGAQVIGPILTGVSKSVHVLQRDAEVGDIVNLTAIAVLDAQSKE